MKNFKFYPNEKIHNLREMLENNSRRYANRPLFLQKEGSRFVPHTYREFYHDVNSLGAAFIRRGLLGKRVIVIGENCYGWCLAYMTVACGLGVIVPVDKEIPAEELANIAKISGASAIIFSEKYREKAMNAGKKLQKYSFDDVRDIAKREDVYSEEDLAAYADISIDIDAMCTLIFTSGTTGVSKGVMLSQRNLCCNIENLAKLVKVEPGDTALSVLPLHHVYECTAGFLFPMSRGASIGFSEGVRYIMKNLKEVRPTKMLCVPLLIETMYNKIWANIRKKGIEHKVRNVIKATDIIKPASARMAAKRKAFAEIHNSMGGNLNLIVSGGAPIDPEVLRGMRQFGFRIIQGYGLTECGPLAAVNPDTASKDISAGVVLPGGEFKIINKGEDGIGEICYRGDNVMLGYYKQPEMTAEIKKNGWLFTGDLGYVDEDGYLTLTLNTERNMTGVSKFIEICMHDYVLNMVGMKGGVDWKTIFINKQALFTMSSFNSLDYFRNLDTDYGILPQPKSFADQESYYSSIVSTHACFFAVPTLQEDAGRTGAIAELLGYLGKSTLTPAYYDKTLNGTHIRDEESAGSIKICFDTKVVDLGDYFSVGSYYSQLAALLNNKQPDGFASMYEKFKNSADAQIKNINTQVDALKANND